MTSAFAGREHSLLDPLSGSSGEKVAGVGQEVGQSAGWVMLLLPSAPGTHTYTHSSFFSKSEKWF